MKTINIILVAFLALILAACTVIVILLQTFNSGQYLSQLTRKASMAIGRPVTIGRLGLGLSSRGLTLDAGPVIVADDTAFTRQPFIQVDRVSINLDLMSLIFHRQIHIINILMQSPQIHIIRSQEGNINVGSIIQAVQLDYRHPEPPTKAFGGKLREGSQGALKSFPGESRVKMAKVAAMGNYVTQAPADNWYVSPENVTIQDAAISYIDQSQSMPLEIWLLNINSTLKDFSLSQPFHLSFDAFPLVRKGIDAGDEDIPLFKDVWADAQLNLGSLKQGGPTVDGQINLTGGVIKNFNIFQVILSRTLQVFGSIDDIPGNLSTQDLVINKATAQFSIHDKSVFINDSSIETNIFELTAKGSVDPGLNMDMQTMLHLNTDVSAALVNEIGGLQFLMDDSKRIAIGASVTGVIPHVKYKPNKDFRKKSRKALMNMGGNILKSLFQ